MSDDLLHHVDALAQGGTISWETLSRENAVRLDDLLAAKAGKFVDEGDGVRAVIFLQERKRFAEREATHED